MQSRNHPSEPLPKRSWRQSIYYYLPKTLTGTAGIGSSLPNIQYAMAFPDNTEVSYASLLSMAPKALAAAIFNGVSTLIISGAFGFRYLGVAAVKIKDEALQAFRERKNRKRFLAVTTIAILAGITGGSISGNPYSGALQVAAEVLGFVFTGAFSFLGTLELIIQLTDKNIALQRQLLRYLKQLDPLYLQEYSRLLLGQELNEKTLKDFLNTLLELAQEMEAQHLSLFRPQTKWEKGKEVAGSVFDLGTSGILTGLVVPIYVQSGFSGSNIISNSQLTSIPTAAKLVIGSVTGFPSALFSFFTLKDFRKVLMRLQSEIKNQPKELLKALIFLGLLAGNSTWYYSLARTTAAAEDNIFSLSVETDFGSLFMGAAFTVAFIMGVNGLSPLVFSPQIKLDKPELADVIKYLEHHSLSSQVMEGLQKHSFLTRVAPLPLAASTVQLAELKSELKRDETDEDQKSLDLRV